MPLNAPIPLAGHHELAEFNSNVPDLDDWLRRRARTNRAGGTSRTFVGCGGSRVIAYYALKFIQLLNVRVADSTLISKNERVKSLCGRYFSLIRQNHGVDAILSQSSDPILYLPSSQLHSAWRWNYGQPLRQAECGDKQFVPQILYMLIAGHVRTIAVWGDALPAVLPEVDFVLLARQEGANSIFGFASWEEVAKLLTASGYQNGPDGFNLDYAIPPTPIAEFVQGFAPVDRSELVKLSPDRILDEELVQRQLAARQN